MSTKPSIRADQIVSLQYTLRDETGEILDSSVEGHPLDYLHGAGNIVPGLEQSLEGRSIGETFQVRVPPEEGYGVHDPRGVQKVPRAAFPPNIDLEPGMQFGAEDESGGRSTIWIQSVGGDEVTIDLNHPLAGKSLDFDVTVTQIRDATSEELAHGHPHGPHGHHHH